MGDQNAMRCIGAAVDDRAASNSLGAAVAIAAKVVGSDEEVAERSGVSLELCFGSGPAVLFRAAAADRWVPCGFIGCLMLFSGVIFNASVLEPFVFLTFVWLTEECV
jgi:hypothetical protein